MGPGLVVPAGQGWQTRSLMGLGAASMYFPAGQSGTAQATHAGWLTALLNVIASHAVHVRSEVAVAGIATWAPAAHTVSGAQLRSSVALGGGAISYCAAEQTVQAIHAEAFAVAAVLKVCAAQPVHV